jgi:hypothetical protein
MRVEVDGRKEANNGLVLYFRRRPGHLAWGYPDRVDLLVVVAVKKRRRVKRILEYLKEQFMELRHNLANEYTVAKYTIEEVRDLLAMLLQGINWEHGRSPGGWSGGPALFTTLSISSRQNCCSHEDAGATDPLEAK